MNEQVYRCKLDIPIKNLQSVILQYPIDGSIDVISYATPYDKPLRKNDPYIQIFMQSFLLGIYIYILVRKDIDFKSYLNHAYQLVIKDKKGKISFIYLNTLPFQAVLDDSYLEIFYV
jgi:hypothetical protein